jgi:hypothetical protein
MAEQIWCSRHSYAAVARHHRQRRNRHLARSRENINCRANSVLDTFLSRRHTQHQASASRPTSRTLSQKTLMAATRDILIPPSHSIKTNIRTDVAHTLSQNVNGARANAVLDAFLPRRRTTSASASGPTPHKTRVVAQIVNSMRSCSAVTHHQD